MTTGRINQVTTVRQRPGGRRERASERRERVRRRPPPPSDLPSPSCSYAEAAKASAVVRVRFTDHRRPPGRPPTYARRSPLLRSMRRRCADRAKPRRPVSLAFRAPVAGSELPDGRARNEARRVAQTCIVSSFRSRLPARSGASHVRDACRTPAAEQSSYAPRSQPGVA